MLRAENVGQGGEQPGHGVERFDRVPRLGRPNCPFDEDGQSKGRARVGLKRRQQISAGGRIRSPAEPGGDQRQSRPHIPRLLIGGCPHERRKSRLPGRRGGQVGDHPGVYGGQMRVPLAPPCRRRDHVGGRVPVEVETQFQPEAAFGRIDVVVAAHPLARDCPHGHGVPGIGRQVMSRRTEAQTFGEVPGARRGRLRGREMPAEVAHGIPLAQQLDDQAQGLPLRCPPLEVVAEHRLAQAVPRGPLIPRAQLLAADPASLLQQGQRLRDRLLTQPRLGREFLRRHRRRDALGELLHDRLVVVR